MDFGGDQRAERVYRALRSAVGVGSTPAREDASIVALARLCRAKAFAIILEGGERSAHQAFPQHATDLLPYYERLFLLTPAPDATTEERQAAVAERYALQLRGAVRDIAAELQTLDSRFEIVNTDPDRSTTTLVGRAFEDLAGAEPFNPASEADPPVPWSGRVSSGFPNYSSEFVAYVVLELGDGVQPNAAERITLTKARRYLHDVLPAHNDIQISTHRGFTLDVSRLDLTSLGGDA